MMIITTFFWALIAGAAPATDALTKSYFALLNAPPRSAMGIVDHRAFCENLRSYLIERTRLEPAARPDPRLLLPTLVRHAQSGIEMSRLFAVLGDPDYGLSVTEFTRVTLDGAFEFRGEPLRASRAFQVTLGYLELPDGHVTKHQMAILAELGKHVVDYADLVALARAPGRESFIRNQVSQTLISPNIERLKTWPLSAHDWTTILSFFDPTDIDDRECASVASNFTNARDARVAFEKVPSDVVRAALQEAAVRHLGQHSRAVIEEMLRPLGPNPSAAYASGLERLRADYLNFARDDFDPARPCESKLGPAAGPAVGPVVDLERAGAAPIRSFKVIDGGRDQHRKR